MIWMNEKVMQIVPSVSKDERLPLLLMLQNGLSLVSVFVLRFGFYIDHWTLSVSFSLLL